VSLPISYEEVESELLPIKLNHTNLDEKTIDYIKKQLIKLVNNDQSGIDDYVVYVLECRKPPLTSLVEEVNAEYTNSSMSRDEIIEMMKQHTDDFEGMIEDFKEIDDLPDSNQEVIDELVEREQSNHDPVDGIPWVKYVLEADTIYYVGYTSNLVRRVLQHVRGNGAFFTSVSPPNSLEQVYRFGEQEKALQAEKEIADILTTLTSENRSSMNQELRKWNRSGERIFAKQS
jgi:predicted GIY-YIG superfamily endonuclease